MKQFLLVIVLAVSLSGVAYGADEKKQHNTKDVAVMFVDALAKADVNRAVELSAVPFSFPSGKVWKRRGSISNDEKVYNFLYFYEGKTLTNKGQLKQKYKDLLKDGKGEGRKYSVTVPNDSAALDQKVFPEYMEKHLLPEYEIYRFTFEGEKEYADIYVKTGDSPKVVGFRLVHHNSLVMQ